MSYSLAHTQPLVKWVPALSRGSSAAGACYWSLIPFLCCGLGKVQLYLYPPSGPHKPVIGITLPYIYTQSLQIQALISRFLIILCNFLYILTYTHNLSKSWRYSADFSSLYVTFFILVSKTIECKLTFFCVVHEVTVPYTQHRRFIIDRNRLDSFVEEFRSKELCRL